MSTQDSRLIQPGFSENFIHSEMVCVAGEGRGILKILDLAGGGDEPKNTTLEIAQNVSITTLVTTVASLYDRTVGSFGLILKWRRHKVNLMDVKWDHTIADIGVDFASEATYTLLVTEYPSSPSDSDELTELNNKDSRQLGEVGLNLSSHGRVTLLVENTAESPINDTEMKASTPTCDDTTAENKHCDREGTDELYSGGGNCPKPVPQVLHTPTVTSITEFERFDGYGHEESEPNRRSENELYPGGGLDRSQPFSSTRFLRTPSARERRTIQGQEEGETNRRSENECRTMPGHEEGEPHRRSEDSYVGLVNQAMTCYLNSLIQALYMTPEFRNALYNWEYVNSSEKDEATSIPYQLQKLFLNLQTSSKNAIETTSLTKSFGWDSTQAWQQHDIQELCRVMFDALEQKFKNTDEADLINRLYEGKMMDYVKCLECGTEKSREDTFLDIPLPVRPFGSNVAYNSVEEALGAFVQPETLDGTNQYHCETCNKKCDAHKGLKFTKFPYFLTLHLKRFDFDYNTFHRIKLNDEVTFPDVLNLNSFIPPMSSEDSSCNEECTITKAKCDDSSTTDSGNLDDECTACDNGMSVSDNSTNENHDCEEDEGIEKCNTPSTSNCNSHNHNEKNRDNRPGPPGPYQYELFSIMIHSGSASGGHYYAYIKDFRTGEWLCFNDQNVSTITYDDIQKTYGGGPARAYYSGVYSSSTNAYMLMYRQIDPERNALPMQVADFPKHLQELLIKMKDDEYNDMKKREMLTQMFRLKVYCHYPVEKTIMPLKLFCLHDETWAALTDNAYKALGLENTVDRDCVRLVTYQESSGLIDWSFDGREDETLSSLIQDQTDLLLEIRKKNETFQPYSEDGITTRVYVMDVAAKNVTKVMNVRVRLTQTVLEYKEQLSREIGLDAKNIYLIAHYPNHTPRVIARNCSELCEEYFSSAMKIFVLTSFSDDTKEWIMKSIEEMLQIIRGLMSVNIQLPDLSEEALRSLNIPTLEENRREKANETPVTNGTTKPSALSETTNDVDKTEVNEVTGKLNVPDELPSVRIKTTSPLTIQTDVEDWNTPEQSNSEDSSLSYSDRTLVGEGDASEDDEYPLTNIDHEFFNQPNQENNQVKDPSEYFFAATRDNYGPDKILRILVDKRMKLGTLKTLLEPHIGVPKEYFRVFCQPAGEIECTRLSTEMSFHDEGAMLSIKLGLALRIDEYKVGLHQLLLDSKTEPFRFLCEWIVSREATVGQTKKEILAELKRKFDIDIPYERCRLRRKNYKTAANVFLDDQKVKDLSFCWPHEIIVQELPGKETVTDPNDVVLFARRMPTPAVHHSPLQEFVVSGKSIDEVRKKLSEISGIPEEFLEMAKGKNSLPDDVILLIMRNCLDFNNQSSTSNSCPPISFEDGTIIYYRDSREKVLELSAKELQDIKTRRRSRTYGVSSTSRYSPRRERALKIYVDDK